MHYGVFRIAPSNKRGHWTFVTSGLSNPWENDAPEEISGLGHEFVLEATTGSDWLLQRMQHVLAFQILLAAGRYVRGPIDPEGQSEIVHLLVCPPIEPSRSFSLVSGRVELYSLTGITEAEAEYARNEGSERLEDLLRRGHAHPVMSIERRSLMDDAVLVPHEPAGVESLRSFDELPVSHSHTHKHHIARSS